VLRQYLERGLADSLRRRSEQIAGSLLANAGKTGENYVVEEIQARYAPENSDRFIRVSRAGGGVLYASGRAASFDPSGLPVPPPAKATRQELCADGARLLITTQSYAAAGRCSPWKRCWGNGAIPSSSVFRWCCWWRWRAVIFWSGAPLGRWWKWPAAPSGSPCKI
jgi:hypothetical protein